jgi:hypothetical protein
MEPILADAALYTENTANGIALYFAPRPFNMRCVARRVHPTLARSLGPVRTVCPWHGPGPQRPSPRPASRPSRPGCGLYFSPTHIPAGLATAGVPWTCPSSTPGSWSTAHPICP